MSTTTTNNNNNRFSNSSLKDSLDTLSKQLADMFAVNDNQQDNQIPFMNHVSRKQIESMTSNMTPDDAYATKNILVAD